MMDRGIAGTGLDTSPSWLFRGPPPPGRDADSDLSPARGIVLGIILSAVFWCALICFCRLIAGY